MTIATALLLYAFPSVLLTQEDRIEACRERDQEVQIDVGDGDPPDVVEAGEQVGESGMAFGGSRQLCCSDNMLRTELVTPNPCIAFR